jgi:leader peptidase (prepilin peptidase)/N-methyltransferase
MQAGPMSIRQWNYIRASAAGIAVLAVSVSLIVAPDIHGVLGAGLAVVMAAIAAIDARYFIIPDELNIAATALGLISACFGTDGGMVEVAGAITRGVTLALAFFGLRLGYRTLRKKDGLGLGDVKLAGAAGIWLGWQTVSMAIEFAALTALIIYVMYSYLSNQALRTSAHQPFGLFFAPAIWLGWLLDTLMSSPF